MKKKPDFIEEWEGDSHPISFAEAQKFAQITHIPFGCLYLDKPSEEALPIPDRRTIGSRDVNVSLELRGTLSDVMLKIGFKPKIPDICDKFGVNFIKTNELLRSLQIRFIQGIK